MSEAATTNRTMDHPEPLNGVMPQVALLPQTLAAATAAAPDATLAVAEPMTLEGRRVLHLGWEQLDTGVHHDAYASADSGRIVLVTTDGAYGLPGVHAERTGDGALAGLVPADGDGHRMANRLEAALRTELPAAKETLFPARQNLARLEAIIEHGQERHSAAISRAPVENGGGPTRLQVEHDGRGLR